MIRIKVISHSSHPQHDLYLFQHPSVYLCNVCDHTGFGPRFACPNSPGCNFNIHEECCTDFSSTPISIHPFLVGSNFIFCKSRTSIRRLYCNACRSTITGSYYHSNSCNRNLHLYCARLPGTITDNGTQMTLANEYNERCSYSCCPKVNSGWSYFAPSGHNYHVACWKLKELNNLNHVPQRTISLNPRLNRLP